MINISVNVTSADPELKKVLEKAVTKVLKEAKKADEKLVYDVRTEFSTAVRPNFGGYRGPRHYLAPAEED